MRNALMLHGRHSAYLIRVVPIVAAFLALWWILLLAPLLQGLRFATETGFRVCLPFGIPAEVAIEPQGNWLFRVPVPAAVARRDEIQRLFGRVSANDPPVTVRSLRLEIPSRDPSLFLVTLPFFWAIVLASESKRGRLRVLGIGSGILLVLAVLLLSFTVTRAFAINTHLQIPAVLHAMFDAGDFASLCVIPYLAPVVAALALDSGLRSSIFTWQPAAPAALPASVRVRPSRRRRTAARQASAGSR